MSIKHCTPTCEYFESHVKDKKYPGYIGVCTRYDRLVTDSLCGCELRRDGGVTLWNFNTLEEVEAKK